MFVNHNALGQLTNHNALGQLTNHNALGQLTNHNALGQLTNHNALGQLTNHNALGQLTNHNALGQLTNHNTFCFSEGRPSSNPEFIELYVSGWGESYCNNVNNVKNNAIFEPPSMRACSSTPPKQNQDIVKEHNRTPLISSFVALSIRF